MPEVNFHRVRSAALLLLHFALLRGRAQFGDLGFLRGDERVELRDLDGVAALLFFAEAEDVGVVCGRQRWK